MGGRQSKHTSLFDERQWTVIHPDQHQLFTNVNTYAIRALRHNRTNEEIEEYQLEFASESDYLSYGKELRLRKEPSSQEITGENNHEGYYYLSPFIYTIKSFVNDTVEDMCSTVYKGRLYAQKVDLRLKEINDIPFPDQLYLTKATLHGFKLLYQKMGYFDICEEIIFINKLGQVKVWIHPNLSMNQPYYYPSNSREPQGSQADMIVKLLDTIEENADQYNHETLHFRDYLLNKNIYDRLSFYKALEEFQLYCVEEHLQVDDSMRSIYELYHPEEDGEVVQVPTNRYRLEDYQLGHNYRERTPSRQRSYTPIKQRQLEVDRNDPLPKVASPTTDNLLYNSHASNRNTATRQASNRPQFQSLERNVYPTNNVPPHFGNTSSLHNRRNSNQTNTQHLQNSRQIPAGPPQPPSIKNQNSFRATSQQNSSERGNAFLNIQRSAQQSKTNHIVKFNYGSYSGAIPPMIQINTAQNQPSSQNFSQKYRPPLPSTIQSRPLYAQIVPPSKQTVLAQPPRQGQVQISNTPFSQHPLNKLPTNLNTLKSIQTDSVPSVVESEQKSSGGSKVTYYSANQVYNLDSEIASDLEAFLGYNARI